MHRITIPLLALVPVTAIAQNAIAEDTPPITDREEFLASVIAAMMLCGIVSFLLAGRASAQIHVALAMLVVLVGAFALFVLFLPVLGARPFAAVLGALAMVALFKFMSQFEARRRSRIPPKK